MSDSVSAAARRDSPRSETAPVAGPDRSGESQTNAVTGWSAHQMAKVPHALRNLVAGGLAGMLAKSVVAPIDRIKILFQVTNQPFHLSHVPRVGLNIIQHEGAPALWRGNSAMMIRVFPYSGIQFMVFDKCKTYCIKRKRQMLDNQNISPNGNAEIGMTPVESLVSGSLAGVVSVFVTYPLDLTRAQLAVYFKKKSSSLSGHDDFDTKRGKPSFTSALTTTYKEKGVVGLYRGITPTVLGILPYAGVAFSINEQSKRKIRTVYERDPTTIEKMMIGGLAGLVAQTLTYPLEVTRRRMQTHGLICGKAANEILNIGNASDVQTLERNATPGRVIPSKPLKLSEISMVEIVKDLYREQGARGFFKGVTMNWVKGPIAFSISFTSYDIIKGWIESSVEADSHTRS